MEPTVQLKAGMHVDPSPSPAAPRVTLLPLSGREGFAFALTVAHVKRASPDAGLACRLVEDHLSRLPSQLGHGTHPQHVFETFLAGLNAECAQVVRTTEWTLPIKSFKCIVGLICDGEMYLSGTGDLTALFLHQAADKRYQVFNLSRNIQTEQALPTWEKPFAVVLDGGMEPGDVFCLCSRDLAPVIGNEDLCGILSTLPPTGAAAKIRQYFPFNDVLALLVLRLMAQDVAAIEAARPRAEVSLERLVEARDTTERLIEDQAPRPASLLAAFLRKMKQDDELEARSRATRRGPVRAGLDRLAAALRRPAKAPEATEGGRARIVREPPVKAGDAAASTFRRLSDVPKRSRALLAGSAIMLVLLGVSISAISRSRAAQKASAEVGARLTAATDLREQAEAAAIYHDEGRALALYDQARAAADAVGPDTPERVQAVERLHEDIAAGLDRLHHVIALADVPLVAAVEHGAAMAPHGTSLYVFKADKSVAKADPALKKVDPLALPASGVGTASEAAEDDKRIVFLDDRPGVSVLDPDAATEQVTTVAPAAGDTWKDLAPYGGRLYVLSVSGTDGQVLRFPAVAAGYGSPTPWIRSKTSSLQSARSLAVDGGVFVLTADRLVRFMNGSETGWEAKPADPPMTDATDVWTAADGDRVYVLEPSKKRVLVFKKDDGTLLGQYRSDRFLGATDLYADEKTGTVYVLTSEGLYGFKLSP